jgi:hypothetical protein
VVGVSDGAAVTSPDGQKRRHKIRSPAVVRVAFYLIISLTMTSVGFRQVPGSRTYSPRSATVGSTFVARRAGMKQASKVTPTRSSVMKTNV